MGIVIPLIIVLLALFIGLAIGAIILRAACHFAGVSVPGFGHAIGIVLVTTIVGAIIGTIINLAFGVPIVQDGNTQVDPIASLSSSILGFVISTLVTILLYKAMIPTKNFGRAALVWLLQLVIVICIVIILGILIFAISAAMGGM